jgi:hypothetical protein
MDAYAQMTQEWSGFFSALAQVSGGLAGLVFVALTFNSRTLGADGDPVLSTLARQTFGDFVVLLLVSLIMLVPHASMGSVALALFISSGLAAWRILGSLLRLRRQLRRGSWEITQRFLLSALGHALLAAVGVELLRGNPVPDRTGSLLFGGVIMLLLSGCRSAWLLVVTGLK